MRVAIRVGVLAVLALIWVVQAAPSSASDLVQGDSPRVETTLDKPRVSRASGVRIERDEATRTITVWLGEPEDEARTTRGRGGYGKVVVRNRSFFYADVYWSLDDFVTPWSYVDTLPPRWKVKFRLLKFGAYLVAAEETAFDDGFWDWGPASFFLRKKFRWTLLP
jgi:hypothetical protein